MEFNKAINTAHTLRKALKEIIIGRDDTIDLVLCGLFAGGHVLLEDYPGSGKTTLTKTLGQLIKNDNQKNTIIQNFKRIQFTPDMLPGDVLGVTVFEPKSGTFRFIPGPVFAHIVLADEINRTGPKVQSAFLECMAERQVTIDNETHQLDELFFVIGTQNPLDIAGTYPLPLVQRDRFLLKIPMTYVDQQHELEILKQHNEIVNKGQKLVAVATRDEILQAQAAVRQVTVHEDLQVAIVDLVQATRNSSQIQHGASTRSALMLQQALRAWALLNERDFVQTSDLAYLAPFVLLHRLSFHPAAGPAHVGLQKLMAPILEVLIKKLV
jgi:MoxR-like ATPase